MSRARKNNIKLKSQTNLSGNHVIGPGQNKPGGVVKIDSKEEEEDLEWELEKPKSVFIKWPKLMTPELLLFVSREFVSLLSLQIFVIWMGGLLPLITIKDALRSLTTMTTITTTTTTSTRTRVTTLRPTQPSYHCHPSTPTTIAANITMESPGLCDCFCLSRFL